MLLSFLKKKLKKIIKKGMEWNCGNGIAKIGGEIFLRNDMFTQFLQYFYNKF